MPLTKRSETTRTEPSLSTEEQLAIAIEALSEHVVLFDAEDQIVIANKAWRDLNRDVAEFTKPGTRFEDHLQALLDKGLLPEAEGREAEWLRERMERHLNPSGPFEVSRQDGRWIRVYEQRLPNNGIILTIGDITESKRVEQALADSELRFRDFAKAASDWFWEMGPDLRLTNVSAELTEQFGLAPDDLIGKTRRDLAVDPDGEELRRHLDDLAARRAFRDFRYEARLPNGKVTHMTASGKPVFDDSGAFLGYRGIVRDIAAEVESQKEAEKAQIRLHDAIESISDGFVLYDSEDRLVLCNEQYRQIYAKSPDYIVPGKTFEEIIRNGAERGQFVEAIGCVDEWVEDRLEQHNNPCGPVEQQLADGKWLRIEERRTKEGGRVGIRTDITELKKREQEARENRELLQAVVDAAPLMINAKDVDSRYVLMNRFHSEILGIEPMDAIGRTASDLMERDSAEQIDLLDRKVLQSGQALPYSEETMPDAQGRRRDWLSTKVPLKDESGQVKNIVTVALEITDQKRMEEQLRGADKLNALGQMAGGVAHDFNNILMVIGGFARRALNRPEDTDRVVRSLGKVIKATDRAGALTKQLLAFCRRQVLETTLFPAASIFQDLDMMLSPLLGETIELSIEISDEKVCVKADAAQLSQALVNLAINGRDAMPSGGALKIGVGTKEPDRTFLERHPDAVQGTYVALFVEDSGTGMDAETLSHIFEPFFTTKDQGKGTGLGLAMVYGFVQQSGGIIEVDSKLGCGTVFTIYLPAVEMKPATYSNEMPEDPGGHGETILLAEDDEGLRQLVVVTLEELGYKVLAASDGAKALELEADHDGTIDVVLSDVVMPNLGGFELAKSLEATRPDAKVILMSGYPGPDEGPDMGTSNNVTFIQKPVTPRILVKTIRQALDEQKARK